LRSQDWGGDAPKSWMPTTVKLERRRRRTQDWMEEPVYIWPFYIFADNYKHIHATI